MILLDTDHLTILTENRAAGHAGLVRRLTDADEPLAIPIVAVEEQCKGWLARINRTREIHQLITPYQRLADLFEFLAAWDIAPLSEKAADLFTELRRGKVRIGSQDLKIAAIALSEDALRLTANLRDFQKVPGVRAANWLQS